MKKVIVLLLLFFSAGSIFSQVENVPLGFPVYSFLKEMSVKKIIHYDDDNPNLSRFEVAEFLKTIDSKKSALSRTETELLNKYKVEYIPEESNNSNTWNMFGSGRNFTENLDGFFSNKQKYMFSAGKTGNNIFIEGLGNVYAGHEMKPDNKINTLMMDGGLGARGTLFNHLGYYLEWGKGMLFGQKNLAPYMEPRMKVDFKFNEDKEKLRNYDYTSAYLKYYIEPMDNFGLSLQFGREKTTFGYGYGSKLILSGDNPDLDLFRLNVKYGVIRFTSMFASTVGYFLPNRDDRYTKYISMQRLKIALPDLFDAAITTNVVYNGRIELAYLNPIMFWPFAEKSLQDRDNKNFALDFQTRFMKNLEIQGTLYIDDDELFGFATGKINKTEKIAYQIGAFAYEPFSMKNLSFTLEYTKIRPYVYTHYDVRDNYTAYGLNLGHRIGPNSDEIFSRLAYNISDWGRAGIEYSFIRKGNNIYDPMGNLVKNVGGDMSQGFRDGVDDDYARFLDGERVNTNSVSLTFRFIPIRNYTFDFVYSYSIDNNITKSFKTDFSYGYVRMNITY
ncbi:MAG: capsule assembly Wzi family protein [Bacteroidetes bacterium]|nr:capsule assembly Wzi family protein [Bacteroidota bacterium]